MILKHKFLPLAIISLLFILTANVSARSSSSSKTNFVPSNSNSILLATPTASSSAGLHIGSFGAVAYDTPTSATTKNTRLRGIVLPITGVTEQTGSKWYRVEYQGEVWWIQDSLSISIEGDLSTVPLITNTGDPLQTPTPTQVTASNPTTTLSAEIHVGSFGTVAYDTPTTTTTKSTRLRGIVLPITGMIEQGDSKWYRVDYQGAIWWIQENLSISIEGDLSTVPLVSNIGEPLQVSTNAPAPTEVATNNPTSIPASTDVSLTQTYTSADGNFSFKYPEGWQIDDTPDNPAIRVHPSDSNLVNLFMIVGSQNISKLLKASNSTCPEENLSTDTGVKAVFDHFLDCINMRQNLGTPQYTDINGKPAAIIHDPAILTIMIDLGNGVPAFAQGQMPSSSDSAFEPVFLAIVGSMEWHGSTNSSTNTTIPSTSTSDVALTQTYTAPDGSFSFKYPEGWTIDDHSAAPLINVQAPAGGFNLLTVLVSAHSISEAAKSGLFPAGSTTCDEGKLSTANGIQLAFEYFSSCTQVQGLTNVPSQYIDLAGKPAVMINQNTGVLFVAFRDLGDGVPAFMQGASTGDYSTYDAIFQAMAGSVEWHGSTGSSASTAIPSTSTSDVALTQTYTARVGNYSFKYPEGWKVDDSSSALISIQAPTGVNLISLSVGAPNLSYLLTLQGRSCSQAELSTQNGIQSFYDNFVKCALNGNVAFTPTPIKVGGKSALLLGNDSSLMIFADLGNGVPLFLATQMSSEFLAANKATILAIAGSVELH